jgi:hypothetical protein
MKCPPTHVHRVGVEAVSTSPYVFMARNLIREAVGVKVTVLHVEFQGTLVFCPEDSRKIFVRNIGNDLRSPIRRQHFLFLCPYALSHRDPTHATVGSGGGGCGE